MSLLMNAFRTVLAVRREQARGESDPATAAIEALPAHTEAAAPDLDATPAWRLLDTQTGVQDLHYGEFARPGLVRLFGQSPRRVLDIGCATGAVGAGLKEALPGTWVWGCELNPEAAQLAAARLDHVSTVPRTEWSAEDLALVATVDTVLLLDVLEHMYNPWAELEFLAQRLPEGAQVIVSLPNVGHVSVLQSLASGSFDYQPNGILDVTHVRFFTLEGMQAMFEQTGFRIEETWILDASPNVQIESFPAEVEAGDVTLTVDSAQHWQRLNAIQYGFRLRTGGQG